MTNLLEVNETYDRSLAPVCAELIGARLMKRLGIGAPTELRIASASEAKAAGNSWIVKSYSKDRLKWWGSREPAEQNLLIRRIPGAISLRALRRRFGIAGSKPNALDDSIIKLLYERDGEDPESDFTAPDDWTAIRAAVAWDSDPMLQIHSARMFLCCSTAHVGNVLVDRNARLYSVDHESCCDSDGNEIRVLAATVLPGRAWNALSKVAALSRADIADLFDDLPSTSWPLGDVLGTVRYFQNRLAIWQSAFTAKAA